MHGRSAKLPWTTAITHCSNSRWDSSLSFFAQINDVFSLVWGEVETMAKISRHKWNIQVCNWRSQRTSRNCYDGRNVFILVDWIHFYCVRCCGIGESIYSNRWLNSIACAGSESRTYFGMNFKLTAAHLLCNLWMWIFIVGILRSCLQWLFIRVNSLATYDVHLSEFSRIQLWSILRHYHEFWPAPGLRRKNIDFHREEYVFRRR